MANSNLVSKKVLIVDDAKVMRATLTNMLIKLGCQVVGDAQNGAEAIEQYKAFKPDFVTMDISMPEVDGVGDGIDAVKHIMLFDNDAKIIMATSHGEKEKVIRAIKNGASNYILKPIDIDKLAETINTLFDD